MDAGPLPLQAAPIRQGPSVLSSEPALFPDYPQLPPENMVSGTS